MSQAEIHKRASSRKAEERRSAARNLGSAFALLPDKEQGWQDLLKLAQDQDERVRHLGAMYLKFAFLPDMERGWQDLLKLAQNQDISVRNAAARHLGSAFALLTDKEQGWQDLLKLAQDQDSKVRDAAARSLGSAFPLLPDKEQGWQDLLKLAQDQDSKVRDTAARSLGSAFALLPDKKQGWQALLRLAQDQHYLVRSGAADALGSSFAFLPDKEKGWKVLIGLAQDQYSEVRANAYHSLGKVSIYRASEASEKNAIRAELEAAVEYFERSCKEKHIFNQARFCLPLYRSYLALTFQGASEEEVERYLAEAKQFVRGSENKKELFGAVENLAKALEETQSLKKKSREQIQSDLKAIDGIAIVPPSIWQRLRKRHQVRSGC
ncbi:MAG: HEAT repeat domain-containing protein [Methanothrix sp.]